MLLDLNAYVDLFPGPLIYILKFCTSIRKLSRQTLTGALQNKSRMLVTGKFDVVGEAELILVSVLPEKAKVTS